MSALSAEGHDTAKLKARHARLDNDLHSEERKPLPDQAMIVTLKKRKLMLKDELARIEKV
ncbi:MAG: YdcH family protein [Rhodospirillaceae bacterium]